MMTELEKQKAVVEFETKQERMFFTGKIIIWIVAILDIVAAAYSLVTGWDWDAFLHCVGTIALSVTLIHGFSWVRILRGTLAALFAIAFFGGILFALPDAMAVSTPESASATLLIIWYSVRLIHEFTVFVFMFFSKSVREYTYGVNEQF